MGHLVATGFNINKIKKTDNVIWLKKYFEGSWSFEREIFSNNSERTYGIAKGSACFTPIDKRTLIYNENGKLSLKDSKREFPFIRSFIYFFDGDQLKIIFNDGINSGKLYQQYSLDINNRVLTSSAQHICKNDCYNGNYTIISPNEYILETLIKGPKKEFKIKTIAKKL